MGKGKYTTEDYAFILRECDFEELKAYILNTKPKAKNSLNENAKIVQSVVFRGHINTRDIYKCKWQKCYDHTKRFAESYCHLKGKDITEELEKAFEHRAPKEFAPPRPRYPKRRDCYKSQKIQLCCYCTKFCGGCEWTDGTFTPVKGWDATETHKQTFDSYEIHWCPKYVNDGTGEP